MYAALTSSRMDSPAPLVSGPDQVTRTGRACRPKGRGTGDEGVLSDVPASFKTARLIVNVSLGV